MHLTDILAPQRVKVPLTATTKSGVIEELVDLLVATGDVTDREKALSAVLERERTRTTGIGSGLAIPHGKCSSVADLVMAVGKPSEPIDFESIDDKPVNLIVMLLSPPDKTGPHIQALARISRLMSLEHLRKRLNGAASAEEVYRAIAHQDGLELP